MDLSFLIIQLLLSKTGIWNVYKLTLELASSKHWNTQIPNLYFFVDLVIVRYIGSKAFIGLLDYLHFPQRGTFTLEFWF